MKTINLNKPEEFSHIAGVVCRQVHGTDLGWRQFIYIYRNEFNQFRDFKNKIRLEQVANIVFKDDERGIELAEYKALSSAIWALTGGRGQHNHFNELSVEKLKENFEKTGSLCGCVFETDGCCGYCYPGA